MSEISGGSAENDEMNTPETGGETGQTGSGGTEGLAGGNLESVQLGEGSEVPPPQQPKSPLPRQQRYRSSARSSRPRSSTRIPSPVSYRRTGPTFRPRMRPGSARAQTASGWCRTLARG